MNQRGRKSSAITVAPSVTDIPRAAPPADLDEFEAHVWTAVVNTKPADWFQADTLPLLESYCRHVSHAKTIDREVAKFDPGWLSDDDGLKRYRMLMDMREKESRAITALARSMRLTQQAQYLAPTAGTVARNAKSSGKKPWEG